jgi:hypothetical protein
MALSLVRRGDNQIESMENTVQFEEQRTVVADGPFSQLV